MCWYEQFEIINVSNILIIMYEFMSQPQKDKQALHPEVWYKAISNPARVSLTPCHPSNPPQELSRSLALADNILPSRRGSLHSGRGVGNSSIGPVDSDIISQSTCTQAEKEAGRLGGKKCKLTRRHQREHWPSPAARPSHHLGRPPTPSRRLSASGR